MFDSIVFMIDIETRPLKPEKQLYTHMLSVNVRFSDFAKILKQSTYSQTTCKKEAAIS